MLSELAPAHRVHAASNEVQPPTLDPVLDRSRAEAELQELPPRNHSVLLFGEPPRRTGRCSKT
jgi:hypothetical protein